MSNGNGPLNLDVDLSSGVVPISKAASSLAALIKRSQERQQPIVITQKGYPSGVLLPVDLFNALRRVAQANQSDEEPAVETASVEAED
ncbi:type II toxin-antitoxin system Phd/YefM family antitoxin [Candidatus Viridilinea mediisalina]|uniref:Antitoxin n=1 Tax=Candidatus Viridilinea mediisalina TaxID=2024553 RepID=A0A2A6RH28_9CHLR|nr:type II toxin-antitoxin system Phd/YefM family antitoxin [Candidatus Viridilinea mediisalina]PDW02188.1 type II toxin-antitoxin system prevent-host-death family antitoxin [Candidatus Viridilinea mediisalina]